MFEQITAPAGPYSRNTLQRRDKKRRISPLEGIPGVGPSRRRNLLKHFGGILEVKKASVADLMKVDNINKKVAEAIYSALYNE